MEKKISKNQKMYPHHFGCSQNHPKAPKKPYFVSARDRLANGVTGKVLDYVWRNSQITIIVEFDDKKLIGMIVYIHFIQEKNVLPTIYRFSII